MEVPAESRPPTGPVVKGSGETTRRLQKELMDLVMSGVKGVSAFPEGDNLFRWAATIEGPKDSVYEGLKFKLSLEFSGRYPYAPPSVQFVTTCFHPNVDSAGNICLDILKDKWTALLDVRTVLISIQSLLNEPNLASPLDPSAAALWPHPKEFKDVMLTKYDGCENQTKAAK